MDAHHVKLEGEGHHDAGLDATVASDYKASPTCRNSLYATGNSQNFDDRSKPGVAAFQDAVNTGLSQPLGQDLDWELEGYASAQWLTDAITSCGAAADPQVHRELPAHHQELHRPRAC